MDKTSILVPVFALVALTFGIGFWFAALRFVAVSRGDLNPGYFKLNRGGKVPVYLAKVSDNYDNLLALPILFYAISTMLIATNMVEKTQIVLAWVYVASRFIHSYIHTTYNNVSHRMKSFMVGVAILFCMWCLFFVRIVQS